MERKYEVEETPYGGISIRYTDTDGVVWLVPEDESNVDYQDYLASSSEQN